MNSIHSGENRFFYSQNNSNRKANKAQWKKHGDGTPKWRQCFALADAKLCVGKCKALRGRLQCFALADAKLCVRVELNGHRKVCPILDMIKGGKTHPTGHLAPRKFLLNPYIRSVLNIHCLCALCAFARAFSRRCFYCVIFFSPSRQGRKEIFWIYLSVLSAFART